MNADVAKPIQWDVVYSETVLDVDQRLAAMQPRQNHFIAAMKCEFCPDPCCVAALPAGPSPIKANGGRIDRPMRSLPAPAGMKIGSPEPVIGLIAWFLRVKPRNAFRLDTEGRIDTVRESGRVAIAFDLVGNRGGRFLRHE